MALDVSTARRPTGRAAMLRYIAAQRNGGRFLVEFNKVFVSACRQRSTAIGSSVPEARTPGKRELRGTNEPRVREPYEHQEAAWDVLDERAATPSSKGQMVALPTGSGKTDVAVEWALRKMASDPTVRVLWVAHQRQLVEQAGARFEALARHLPQDFTRTARIVHGSASGKSALGDPSTDVVLATVQTLTLPPIAKRQLLVESFMKRPTIVVIDEAHRSGATGYQTLLEIVSKSRKVVAVIGLSATPEPVGDTARKLVERRFPRKLRVVERTLAELIEKRILAQPVFHTAIPTRVRVELTDDELSRTRRQQDLPPAALARLNVESRNELIVQTWKDGAARWGKTLVFATSIENADALTQAFQRSRVPTQVVHSRSATSRSEALAWWRDQGDLPSVLVSVGMLTEGVDLPDARTAFLTRPTTSHVLLNQMIGRVLRGPAAGGESQANVVYFADEWPNFGGVLTPRWEDFEGAGTEVPDGEPITDGVPSDPGEVPDAVRDAVERLLGVDMSPESMPAPPLIFKLDALSLRETRTVGYYECSDGGRSELVLVMDGQHGAFERLAQIALGRKRLAGLGELFADCPPPHPAEWHLKLFADQVRTTRSLPPFVELELPIGPWSTAQDLVAAGPLTERERFELVRTQARGIRGTGFGGGEVAYEEAVQRAVRMQIEARTRPDSEIAPAPGRPPLPRNRRRDVRWLRARLTVVARIARSVLAEEPELGRLRPPPVEWTRQPILHAFAYHRIRTTGAAAGDQVIRVNSVLQAPAKHVPEGLVDFVLWHELMHHLLPGHGHDARFEDFESRFPEWMKWNALLDRLDEEWDLSPSAYPT